MLGNVLHKKNQKTTQQTFECSNRKIMKKCLIFGDFFENDFPRCTSVKKLYFSRFSTPSFIIQSIAPQ